MSTEIINFIILFFLGGLGGLLAGLLGIGGGIIYVLIFSHYLEKLGVPEAYIVPAIVANSMFAIMFAGISGTYKQWRKNNFFPKEAMFIAIGASSASLLFSYLISTGTWYNKERFTIFFILLLLFIAYKLLTSKDHDPANGGEIYSVKKFLMIGSISGTIAAFSGVGGGVIIVPLLINLKRIPIKKATSISLGVISVMAFFTSLFYIFFHHIPEMNYAAHMGLVFFSVAIPVALGSLVFSPIGVNISSSLSAKNIRIIFVVFLLLVIIKMLYGIL